MPTSFAGRRGLEGRRWLECKVVPWEMQRNQTTAPWPAGNQVQPAGSRAWRPRADAVSHHRRVRGRGREASSVDGADC